MPGKKEATEAANRFTALGGTAEPPAAATARRPRRPGTRKPATARTSATRPAAMPAEQKADIIFSERISLTVTPDQKRALDLARLEDGIPVNARIRAMIRQWEDSQRYRASVDRLAPGMRERDRKSDVG